MTAATDTMPALPEPHGYVGACNHYCLQPKDSPLMPEKLNRWTADQVRAYGDQRAEHHRAENDRLRAECKEWRATVWGLSKLLNCLPSSFSDDNTHVYKAAEKLQAECEALRKDAARLDAGCIMMDSRDEFGDTIKCEHRGMNLRAAIDEAIAYAALSTSTAPSGAEE